MNSRIRLALHTVVPLVLLSMMLAACGGGAPARPAAELDAVAPAGAPAVAPGQAEARGAVTGDSTTADQLAARLVVRNANLTLIVQDTRAQIDAIVKLAADLKGYVASSSTTQYDAGLQAKTTLRIPAEEFDNAIKRLHELAIEVRTEEITGQDVTAEYTDLNSRLTNLQAAEQQLRTLMEKAEKSEDVLAIFNQLTSIRGEIEQIKGRMQYLSQSAAMATIDVTLIPDKLAQPLQVAGWRPEGVVKSAVEALIGALQGLATLVIWLVIVIAPVGAILLSPFILLYILLRRRNRRKQLAKP